MIKVKTIKNGNVKTRIKGETMDIVEELLNANVSIFKTLVEKGFLPEDKIEEFVKDFAQQTLDAMKEDK